MSTKSIKVERAQKPKKCPACGHAPLASILYGLPAFTAELRCKMDAGRVILGGCCISGDDPAWECPECGLKVFRSEAQ